MACREQWKDIPGWENRYQISDQGRVWSKGCVITRSNGVKFTIVSKIIKQAIDEQGGALVRLYLNRSGKTYRVHTLVLLAFMGPPKQNLIACHGPNGVSDNRLVNLVYATRSKNNFDKYRVGTMTCAKSVRRSDGQEYPSSHQAARENNVTSSSIRDALTGRSKTCNGFTWSYA